MRLKIFIGSKKIVKKILRQKIFLEGGETKNRDNKLLGQTNFWVKKKFWVKKIFWVIKIFGKKFLG